MRPTQAHIDLQRLLENYQILCGHHTRGRLMTVLKAEGYGHGMLPAAHLLQSAGQDLFAVAQLEEGMALRADGIAGRILVLGAPPRGSGAEYAGHGLEMTIPSLDHLEGVAAGPAWPGALPVHLKLDTGMSRIGMSPADLPRVQKRLEALPQIRISGVYSHFVESEAMGSDRCQTQYAAFSAATAALPAHVERHLANSAGLMRNPEFHFDYARTGFSLWAPMAFTPPGEAPAINSRLGAVMTLCTEISFLKRMHAGDTLGYGGTYTCAEGEWVATLPIGYGDGLFRALASGGGRVAIGRRTWPIAGRVSMDQMTVSLGTGDAPAALGYPAVLFGPEESGISVAQHATWAGTIDYEIFTHLNRRIPRVYHYQGRHSEDWRSLLAPGHPRG